MPKSDKEIDAIIGGRIHELRLAMGLSRVQLAQEIGVTHQQLQKYEKGMNRICVARLIAIAKALRKSATYFLVGFDGGEPEEASVPTHHQRMAMEVSRSFMRIKSAEHQQAVNSLVRVLAEGA